MTIVFMANLPTDFEPVSDQAKARGIAPPLGSSAAEVRSAGFLVPRCIPPQAIYVADGDSPSVYYWDEDVWDCVDWWLGDEMGELSDNDLSAIVSRVNDEEWRDAIKRLSIRRVDVPREEVLESISTLPECAQIGIREALGNSAENVADLQKIERAVWQTLLALADRAVARLTAKTSP